MKDLRLYTPSDQYEDYARTSEAMFRVVPDDITARSIEVIAGKVVKFLLTEKGSDAFNSDYGGTSMHYLQMSQLFLPQFKREVIADIERCQAFLKNADREHNEDNEQLDHINLVRVDYDPRNTPWRVDVYIEVFTTEGKRAVVAITPKTDE